MSLIFRGHFDEAVIEGGDIIVMPRPYMRVVVVDGDNRAFVDFPVDTGCDKTILHPRDAYRIWRHELLRRDFEGDPSSRECSGVGGTAISVQRPVRLSFVSDDERVQEVSFACNIEVAMPDDRLNPHFSNWDLPSLMGRDVLAHFRLELAYLPTPRLVLSLEE